MKYSLIVVFLSVIIFCTTCSKKSEVSPTTYSCIKRTKVDSVGNITTALWEYSTANLITYYPEYPNPAVDTTSVFEKASFFYNGSMLDSMWQYSRNDQTITKTYYNYSLGVINGYYSIINAAGVVSIDSFPKAIYQYNNNQQISSLIVMNSAASGYRVNYLRSASGLETIVTENIIENGIPSQQTIYTDSAGYITSVMTKKYSVFNREIGSEQYLYTYSSIKNPITPSGQNIGYGYQPNATFNSYNIQTITYKVNNAIVYQCRSFPTVDSNNRLTNESVQISYDNGKTWKLYYTYVYDYLICI